MNECQRLKHDHTSSNLLRQLQNIRLTIQKRLMLPMKNNSETALRVDGCRQVWSND